MQGGRSLLPLLRAQNKASSYLAFLNSKTKERVQKGGEPWVGERIALCIDEQPWDGKQGRPVLQHGL